MWSRAVSVPLDRRPMAASLHRHQRWSIGGCSGGIEVDTKSSACRCAKSVSIEGQNVCMVVILTWLLFLLSLPSRVVVLLVIQSLAGPATLDADQKA